MLSSTVLTPSVLSEITSLPGLWTGKLVIHRDNSYMATRNGGPVAETFRLELYRQEDTSSRFRKLFSEYAISNPARLINHFSTVDLPLQVDREILKSLK
jgi:hypothetical protein